MPTCIRVHKSKKTCCNCWREWYDGFEHSSLTIHEKLHAGGATIYRGLIGSASGHQAHEGSGGQWVNLPGLPTALTQSIPGPAEPLGKKWPGTHVIVLWPSTIGARKGVACGHTLENKGFVQQPKFNTSDRFHAGAVTNLTTCDKQPDRFVLYVFYRLLTNRALREVTLWHIYPKVWLMMCELHISGGKKRVKALLVAMLRRVKTDQKCQFCQ